MDDRVDRMFRDDAGDEFVIADIARHEREFGRDCPPKSCGKIVKGDDALAGILQRQDHVAADVAGCAGDQNRHYASSCRRYMRAPLKRNFLLCGKRRDSKRILRMSSGTAAMSCHIDPVFRAAPGDKAPAAIYEPAASLLKRAGAMAEILFVKTSSLGDIVHQMPAVTDARRHRPDARLTWVVEENYAPLARLHPGIDEVIPVASRRWRAGIRKPAMWGETFRDIGRFRRAVRAQAYDVTIDTQGLLRSAAIAWFSRGVRHGYDMSSIREPPAALLYDVRHRVDWGAHAIRRNRTLCALALGYTPEPPVDFGLDRGKVAGKPSKAYAVLLHGTARPTKEWDRAHWVAVARGLCERGLAVVLPWGSVTEQGRSERIAAEVMSGAAGSAADVTVPPRRPLDEVAALIAHAALVVGVDTGLAHVAAAFGVPLIAIFIGSEPGLTGPMGTGCIEVIGGKGAAPEPAAVLRAVDRVVRKQG